MAVLAASWPLPMLRWNKDHKVMEHAEEYYAAAAAAGNLQFCHQRCNFSLTFVQLILLKMFSSLFPSFLDHRCRMSWALTVNSITNLPGAENLLIKNSLFHAILRSHS